MFFHTIRIHESSSTKYRDTISQIFYLLNRLTIVILGVIKNTCTIQPYNKWGGGLGSPTPTPPPKLKNGQFFLCCYLLYIYSLSPLLIPYYGLLGLLGKTVSPLSHQAETKLRYALITLSYWFKSILTFTADVHTDINICKMIKCTWISRIFLSITLLELQNTNALKVLFIGNSYTYVNDVPASKLGICLLFCLLSLHTTFCLYFFSG